MPTTRSKQPKLQQSRLIFEPTDGNDHTPRLPQTSKKTPRGATQTRLSSYLDVDAGPSNTSPLASSQVNRSITTDYSFGEPETSGDEGVFTAPHRIPKATKRKRDEFVVPDEEEESSEDDIVLPSRKKRSSPKAASIKSSRIRDRRIITIDSDSEEDEQDSEDEHTEVSDGEDEAGSDNTAEESDIPVKRRRSVKASTMDEQEELLEELEDLRDNSPPIDSTSKSRKAAAQRRDTLEEMRNARFGNTQQGSFDADEYDVDDDEDDDNLAINEDADDDDDGFIESDEDDEPIPQLPLNFSSMAAASAEDFFEDMLRWMVHLILRNVVLDEDIYQLAHDKIERQCAQWGESFRSSVWRPEFIKAMLARPEIHTRMLTFDGLGTQCDGCSRADTYSTAEVWFTGNPYDPYTLEEIEQTLGEPIIDRQGNELVDSEFCLGKTCFKNTITAHPLGHWKYHLKKMVEKTLERELRHSEVIKREDWTEEKRVEHADDITDRLLNSGDASDLWNGFKGTISHAWNIRSVG